VVALVARRQLLERGSGRGFRCQCRGEVVRERDRAGRVVELELDVVGLAAGDASTGAILRADADEVSAVHRRDGAPVGVAVDRHPDRRPLALSQAEDDVLGNREADGRLAGLLEEGTDPLGRHVIVLRQSFSGTQMLS
jgi:hypothetical protein